MSQATEVARMSESNQVVAKWDSIKQFYRDVMQEMKRVSWPSREEVSGTTLVVIIAVFFFGFFLWGADVLITLGFDQINKLFR
ncbi:MAG: preprotein translocase subunit SecE [Blastocatellia bacterium]|nr:preprotein translocase subunit SecE [Blastocatellia bacterium]